MDPGHRPLGPRKSEPNCSANLRDFFISIGPVMICFWFRQASNHSIAASSTSPCFPVLFLFLDAGEDSASFRICDLLVIHLSIVLMPMPFLSTMFCLDSPFLILSIRASFSLIERLTLVLFWCRHVPQCVAD